MNSESCAPRHKFDKTPTGALAYIRQGAPRGRRNGPRSARGAPGCLAAAERCRPGVVAALHNSGPPGGGTSLPGIGSKCVAWTQRLRKPMRVNSHEWAVPDHLVILATRGFASRPVQHGDQPALVGNRPQLLKTRRGLEHAFAADPEHVAYELLSHRQAAAAQAIHRQQRPATQLLVDQVLQRDDGIGRKSDVSHGAARLMHHGPQWQRHQFQVWEQSTLNFWRQGSQRMILLGLGPGRHSALRLRGAEHRELTGRAL